MDGLKRGASSSTVRPATWAATSRSRVGTQVTDGGVTIIGAPYLASEVSNTASNLLARNVGDVLAHFVHDGRLSIDLNEELDDALIVAGRPAAESKE